MAAKAEPRFKVVAENRKARFNYEIGEKFEAGIALTGTEVKSLRLGRAVLTDAYGQIDDGEAWLLGLHIPEYTQGTWTNHEPRRTRKLLLNRIELDRLLGKLKEGGMTLVPLSVYFNARGRAKVELALAKGKQAHDKRQTQKDRDWQRDKARLMRERG